LAGFSALAISQFTSARKFALAMAQGAWYWGLASIVIFALYFV
jgi:hypothetical protein